MSKPSDIPQDVWEAAIIAVSMSYDDGEATETVARAILAERERAARIAETFTAYTGRGRESDENYTGAFAHGNKHATGQIAMLIRSSSP